MERWVGKVAVVTGASAGIGAAIVRSFVRQGMIVAGFARRVEKVKEIADSLEDSPGKLHPVECDIAKEESIIAAFAWVKDNLGPISVLVNSAGITKESSLIDGTLEDWQSVFDVNVLGLCLCTREAVRMMRETEAEDAVVIHVNSLAAERVPFIPGFSVYPASKRAITGLAMTLRHELAGTRIRVTNISPGLVATEFMASYSMFSPEAMAAAPTLDPDDVAAAEYIIQKAVNHPDVDYARPPNRGPDFQWYKKVSRMRIGMQKLLVAVSSNFFSRVYINAKSSSMNLSNKIAVVTGACSAIGKLIVEELVLKGLKVVGLSSDINKLKILVDELKSKPGKLYPLQCDLSLPNEIEAASEWIEKNLGSVDILINNAGVSIDWSSINGGIQELKKSLDINVLGLSWITKKILLLMKNKGVDNGCIVNINDICGLKWLPLVSDRPISPAYVCSKSALAVLTDWLRLELAQNESNIKVISICPGLVETEMTQQWLKENSRLALKPKDVADAILYALQTPENVLIKELVITPIREM